MKFSQLKLLPLAFALALDGCSAQQTGAESGLLLSKSSITLKPLELEGAAPFCIYSPEVHIDSQKVVLSQPDQVRACTSTSPKPRRDPAARLYWKPSTSRDFPFWAYNVITVSFRKTEFGSSVTYSIPLNGKLAQRPGYVLAGMFLVVTDDSVQVKRWDIKPSPGQPVYLGIQEVSLVAEVKEGQR